MINFIAQIGIGVSLFIFGLQLFFKPRLHNIFYGFYWDLTGHNRFWGCASMVAGIVFLLMAMWARAKSKKKGDDTGDNNIVE